MVDHQPHGNRDVFIFEELDVLRDTVLVNLKILLAQVADEGALPAGHGGVQHHQGNIH